MTTKRYSPVESIDLTSFYGGAGRGACLQLTLLPGPHTEKNYVGLTRGDAQALAEALLQWVDGQLPEAADE